MNSRCFCPPESLAKLVFAFSGQPPALEQLTPVGRVRVERGIELERLTYLQLLRQLGLLQLHAYPLVQPVSVGPRIEAEDPDLPVVTFPQALQALDRGGLARAVRAEDAEDLTPVHVERDVVHDGLDPSPPVTLGEPRHLDDCRHHAPRFLWSPRWRHSQLRPAALHCGSPGRPSFPRRLAFGGPAIWTPWYQPFG
jgi:hypothetical protein